MNFKKNCAHDAIPISKAHPGGFLPFVASKAEPCPNGTFAMTATPFCAARGMRLSSAEVSNKE